MNAAVDLAPTARMLDCSEAEYFDDPCEVPSLSQSIAKRMVAESPLHAWQFHPRLGKQQEGAAVEEDTKAKDAGHIIHKLLLGKGAEIVVCPFDDFKKQVARDMRDEARAAGKVPVIEHRMAEYAAAAEILKEKLALRGFVLNGMSEVSFEWDELGERGLVRCRARMDHLKLSDTIAQILDVKKIKSAHPQTISDHIYKYGYDIQHEAYTRCIGTYRPQFAGRVDFVFLFMEIDPPYVITPVRLPGSFLEIGRQRWERAVLLWERCCATNVWPEYCEEVIHPEPRPWVLTQELGSDW